jgi:hypothetical protein
VVNKRERIYMKEEKIDCTVRTPQFVGAEVSYHLTQNGTIDTSSWEFTPYAFMNGNHKIQFGSEAKFNEFKIA